MRNVSVKPVLLFSVLAFSVFFMGCFQTTDVKPDAGGDIVTSPGTEGGLSGEPAGNPSEWNEFTGIAEMQTWLAGKSRNGMSRPYAVRVSVEELDEEKWIGLCTALYEAGRYVRLNLGASTPGAGNRFGFRADYSFDPRVSDVVSWYDPATIEFFGQAYVCELILPESATTIPPGIRGIADVQGSLRGFSNCAIITGPNVQITASPDPASPGPVFHGVQGLRILTLPKIEYFNTPLLGNYLQKIRLSKGIKRVYQIHSQGAFEICRDAVIELIGEGNAWVSADGKVLVTETGEVALVGSSQPRHVDLTGSPVTVEGLSYKPFSFKNSANQVVSVILPEGLTAIPSQAFYNCHDLVSVTIPSTVTVIKTSAFTSGYPRTPNLTELICKNPVPPELQENGGKFRELPLLQAVRVPAGSVDAYKTAGGWQELADKITAIQ
jgi:hypothetical protein